MLCLALNNWLVRGTAWVSHPGIDGKFESNDPFATIIGRGWDLFHDGSGKERGEKKKKNKNLTELTEQS